MPSMHATEPLPVAAEDAPPTALDLMTSKQAATQRDLDQAKDIITAHEQNIRSLELVIASKQAALDASGREIRSQKDKIAMLREIIHDAMVAR